MKFNQFLRGVFASMRWRLTFIAIVVLLGFFLWEHSQSWPSRQVDISGTVVDVKKGNVIPRSKIIISVWDISFWDGYPLAFGRLTDEEGRFRFKENFDFRVDNVNIEICTPYNEYLFFNSVENRRDQVFEIGKPHPQKGVISSYRKYEEFNESAQWGKEVVFK